MADTLTTKATIFGLNQNGTHDNQDNGVGFMGANTRDPGLVGVSIPIDAFKQMYGSVSAGKQAIQQFGSPQFEVTNPATGQTILAPLSDLGPSLGPQKKGVGLDLTYGASQALGGTGLDTMNYRVASAPGSVGNILAGQFGTAPISPELNTVGDTPVNLTQAFTPTSQPKLPTTGGVNPATGQLVEGATVGPMARKGGNGFNPIQALSELSESALTGGANVGTTIVQALPLVNQFAQGISGKDTSSNLGKVGGSVRNVFEGDVGSGNPNTPWPTIQESIASIFSKQGDPIESSQKTMTASSSANGSYAGVMDSIKNFFGSNGSSNSTGPVGNNNVDTSRYG